MTDSIQDLTVNGYKSFRALEMKGLGALNVLIGPNGAGKSNLLSAFRLLNAVTEQRLGDYVARGGGAANLLHHGPRHTDVLELGVSFLGPKGHLNSYRAELGWASGDSLAFRSESVELRPAEGPAKVHDIGLPGSESQLAAVLAEPTSPRQGVARFIKFHLDRWRFHHFHDTSDLAKVKQYQGVHDDRFLRSDAANLAPFLMSLRADYKSHYDAIVEVVRRVYPPFLDFVLEPSTSGQLMLRWQERGSDTTFGAHQLSDGTLRFICLATLLNYPSSHPNRPYTVALDEPELGLHPFALSLLASLLSQASNRYQLIISTQSATLLSLLGEASQVWVVERGATSSSVRRVDQAELAPWLDDYTLGEIWEKGVVGGFP